MDYGQEQSMWRAIGACEGSVDEFERRIARVERRLIVVAVLAFAVGLSIGAATSVVIEKRPVIEVQRR